jgi:hypothetical protein
LAPVGAYWALSERASRVSFDSPLAVDDVVRVNSGVTGRDVALALTWQTPGELVAPEWGGMVQAVAPVGPAGLRSGDVVARVAGVDRLACASRYPMTQGVAAKDKGQDVATLQECLTLFGHDVAGDKGVYGSATRAVVAALAATTGAASDKGAVFDAGWLVFLPQEGYQPTSLDLVVGAPAPPAGAVLAEAAPVLSGAVLTPASAAPQDDFWAGDYQEEDLEDDATAIETLTAEADETLTLGGRDFALAADRAQWRRTVWPN